MNKSQFLKILNDMLKDIPEDEKKDILFDYNEHFSIGLKEGRSEEEIVSSLGDPKTIAKEIKANYMISKAEKNISPTNVFMAVLATLGLGFFNLVFVIGPYIGVAAVIFSLFVTGGSIVITGIALFFGTFMEPILPQYIFIPAHPLVSIFASFGLTALGLLWIIGTTYLTKGFYKITIKYLKMNLNIIVNRRSKNEA